MAGLGIIIPRTGGTGPIVPHSAGVAGYDRRFIMGQLTGADGAAGPATIPNQVSGGTALTASTTPAGPVLATTAGVGRHLASTTAGNYAGSTPPLAPVTIAAVCRSLRLGSDFLRFCGYSIRRASDGRWQIGGAGGGVLVAANANWVCVVGVGNTTSSALYVDGLSATGSITPPGAANNNYVINSAAGTGLAVEVAEVITWPTALTAADAAAIRAAMKAKYTLLA
jgi:hypothetical protein